MKIDIISHIVPEKLKEVLRKKTNNNALKAMEVFEQNPVLSDVNLRFRLLDRYPDLLEVLVPALGPLETLVSPAQARDLAKLNNDEMAELVEKYPDKFLAAVALLPQNNIEAAQKEVERAVTKLGMRGILLHTNVNGETLDLPKFRPLYAQMTEYDLPIFVHPSCLPVTYPPMSKDTLFAYQNHFNQIVASAIQWPVDTSLAMIRLAMTGIFREYPNIKLITHQCGGLVPFCQDRIILRDDDMHKFYSDTALFDTIGPLMCGYAFFGSDRLLFGTDTPLGRAHGYGINETIKAIEHLDISDTDKEKIFERNALRLLRLSI